MEQIGSFADCIQVDDIYTSEFPTDEDILENYFPEFAVANLAETLQAMMKLLEKTVFNNPQPSL